MRPPDAAFPDPIPDILPFGTIGTFAGAPGVGKTALLASWVRRWLDGRTICGHQTGRPTSIAFLVGDRRWQSHEKWLQAAGCENTPHLSLWDDDKFLWASLRNWAAIQSTFARLLDQLAAPAGSLIVVDPMPLFLPGRVNEYRDVAIGLGTLGQEIKKREYTCLGVFHQAKQLNDRQQQYRRPQDRILGSAAQLGFTDTAMYLLSPEDLGTDYYGFGWVPHNAPGETFRFARDAWGMFGPYQESLTDQANFVRIMEIVPAFADPTGISAAVLLQQVQTRCSVSVSTAKRWIAHLLESRLILQPKRGRYKKGPVS